MKARLYYENKRYTQLLLHSRTFKGGLFTYEDLRWGRPSGEDYSIKGTLLSAFREHNLHLFVNHWCMIKTVHIGYLAAKT